MTKILWRVLVAVCVFSLGMIVYNDYDIVRELTHQVWRLVLILIYSFGLAGISCGALIALINFSRCLVISDTCSSRETLDANIVGLTISTLATFAMIFAKPHLINEGFIESYYPWFEKYGLAFVGMSLVTFLLSMIIAEARQIKYEHRTWLLQLNNLRKYASGNKKIYL